MWVWFKEIMGHIIPPIKQLLLSKMKMFCFEGSSNEINDEGVGGKDVNSYRVMFVGVFGEGVDLELAGRARGRGVNGV